MAGSPDFTPLDPAVVPRFADIATFMRTRRCEPMDEVDIAMVGVPFDIGLNYRSGARQGPAGVREASRIIRRVHPTSGIRPFEICNVADLGDAPVNPMSKDASIEMIEAFFAELRAHRIVPIAVGGDHTIPLPILRALARDRPVGVLHFDAHADTGDSDGGLWGHGTPMRRLILSGAVRGDRFLQIGLRGYWPDPPILEWMADQRMRWFEMTEVVQRGIDDCLDEALEVVADDCDGVFLSVDVDVVDPGMAPGTGTPESGGLTSRQLLDAVRRIGMESNLLGMDVVEVAPPYDTSDVTALLANRVVLETLSGVTVRRKSNA